MLVEFGAVRQHVASDGKALVILKDVKSHSADREGAFDDHAPRTRSGHTDVQPRWQVRGARRPSSLTCYLNTPSKLAGAEQMKERR